MATIHMTVTTTATPEQFVAALTDFGPGRKDLFPNSADDYLEVHDQGPTSADVTEGSSGIWERLRYDWSDPNRVVMTTTDSNTWGGNSGHTYTLHAAARWDDRGGRRRGTRWKEPQGTGARGRALDLRQARPGRGAEKDRQGRRSPKRRRENGRALLTAEQLGSSQATDERGLKPQPKRPPNFNPHVVGISKRIRRSWSSCPWRRCRCSSCPRGRSSRSAGPRTTGLHTC